MVEDRRGKTMLRGHDAAFYLVDVLFSRKLMTFFSWTGTVAREGTVHKSAFKAYTRTVALFQQLVQVSDTQYTALLRWRN